MIFRKLLGPIVVIALAAIDLAAPREAQARTSMACGTEYAMQCRSMTELQINLFCDAACSNWMSAVCNTDSGGLRCLSEPF